ncbi:hypothetical protein BRADI_3g05115v3 [Brachypodium distachyon]|uniref:F-box domain-containing protein n=1 Tax=Brachypodium distachyon TaxID=15368 RepID=A0A0Q3J5L2_BRADI|nr:hypothetical protein BRADI_3g05115v3 [Brachypodium distachyon]
MPPPPPGHVGSFILPDVDADVVAEILARLPPNARRRARLVCRLWRAAVDERTATSLGSRARPLVFVAQQLAQTKRRDAWWHSSAYAIYDDHAEESQGQGQGSPSPKIVWSNSNDYSRAAIGMVGTRNGILCLCNNGNANAGGSDDKPPFAGDITLVNPVTRDTLAIPGPLHHPQKQDSVSPAAAAAGRSTTTRRRWHETYSFAYDEDTGQYKILHIPCYDDGRGSSNGRFDAVKVFSLGDPLSPSSWRDVPAPAGSSCSLGNGLLSVGGAAYWVTKDRRNVMSFHLWKECFTTKPLPGADELGYSFRLAMVLGGRLGIAVDIYARNTETGHQSLTKVWVAESEGWSDRQDIHVYGVEQRPTKPDFALGEYILTNKEYLTESSILHVHKLKNDKQKLISINKQESGTGIVTKLSTGGSNQTFAYVETRAPLSTYKFSGV